MNEGTSTLLVLKTFAGNEPTTLNALQRILEPYLEGLTALWIALWVAAALVALIHLWEEYRKQRLEGKN